jgi:hypothetical protein
MHSRKKETLYETKPQKTIRAHSLTANYNNRRCVEFVYFLPGEAFLGNCLAALIFWFFFIKKKERQLLLVD